MKVIEANKHDMKKKLNYINQIEQSTNLVLVEYDVKTKYL